MLCPGQMVEIMDLFAFIYALLSGGFVIPFNAVQNAVPHRCRLGDARRDTL